MKTTATASLKRMTAPTLLLGLSLSVAACGEDDPADDTLTKVQGNFVAPESAHWDATNNVWYVSSLGQPPDNGVTPDAPAYISRISRDGTVIDERWVEMNGDFYGMDSLNGTLYVSHATDLLEVNIATGATNIVNVPGAIFLNDVAVGEGFVYLSDTIGNRIYRYTPGGTVETFSDDSLLVAPNGLLVDGATVLVGTLGSFPPDPSAMGGIYMLDAGGKATRLGTVSGFFDGFTKAGDQYLVSDFGGSVYLIDADDGQETLVANFTMAPHDLMATADIGYEPTTRTVMVPDLLGSTVRFFELP